MLYQMIFWLKYGLFKLGVDEEGQGLVEYALIIALIAIVLIAALVLVAGGIENVFDRIVEALDAAPGEQSSFNCELKNTLSIQTQKEYFHKKVFDNKDFFVH